MVEWLSSIKEKNLNYCGKLVLTGDMSTLSITKVDLSNMNTLEGKLCCLKATNYGTLLGMFFLSPLTDSTSPPTTLGSIEVFQGMPIQKLNLYYCRNLTGEGLKSQGPCCSNLRCCPRATPNSDVQCITHAPVSCQHR